MPYHASLRKRAPTALALLCLSLWSGLLFNVADDLISSPNLQMPENTPTALQVRVWAIYIALAVAQAVVFRFLLKGRNWARWTVVAMVGLSLLMFVPPLLTRDLYVVTTCLQMPYRGWPDLFFGILAMSGLVDQGLWELLQAVKLGISITHMGAAVMIPFLPGVREYFQPLKLEDEQRGAPRRGYY